VYTLLYTVSLARIIHGWPVDTKHRKHGCRFASLPWYQASTDNIKFILWRRETIGGLVAVGRGRLIVSQRIDRWTIVYIVCIRWWRLRAAFARVIYYFIISYRTPLGLLGVGVVGGGWGARTVYIHPNHWFHPLICSNCPEHTFLPRGNYASARETPLRRRTSAEDGLSG